MPDFREIRAISHQTSHPRIKTSRFFCKDSHPASYYVCNSPHFKQSPPGRDAKKAAQNSASWHRTTQQSTPEDTTQRKHPETLRRGTELRSRVPVSFARVTTPPETLSIIRPVSRTTASRMTMLSVKQGILRTKPPTLQFTIAGHASHTTKTKESDRGFSVRLFIISFPVITAGQIFAYRLIILGASAGW